MSSSSDQPVHIEDVRGLFSCPEQEIVAVLCYGDDKVIRECEEFPLTSPSNTTYFHRQALRFAQAHCAAFWRTHTAEFFRNDLEWGPLEKLEQQVIYCIRNNGDIHFRHFGNAIPLVKEGAAELDAYLKEKCI